ncbi:unnamed protein product [Polarella glacialis]|uniref:Uncharacterized protein n=1 Tax=Polarella glacialis TaxID=89957 RepID=A0A813F5C2_POLGL|nr:unnamed protein product [Polarella glacialis]
MKGLTRLFASEGEQNGQTPTGSPGRDRRPSNASTALDLPSPREAQLEAALEEERKKCVQKDEEVLEMQNSNFELMAKLEGAIEQQARFSEQEKERLSSLEAAYAQKQQSGQDDKVTKLLLALQESKRRAEEVERLRHLEASRADRLDNELQELRKNLALEQIVSQTDQEMLRLRGALADEKARREEVEANLAAASQVSLEKLEKVMGNESIITAIRDDVQDSQRLRDLLELADNHERLGQDPRLQELMKKMADAELARRESQGLVSIYSPSELQERLNSEEQRRRDAETLAAEREGQLRHLRQQLSGEETELQYREQQQEDKVREMRRQKSEALMQVAAKEAQVAELQRQVAEKFSQRQAAQKQPADKERLLKDLKEQPSDRLFQQQAAQTQAIEIQREVCNLQQQLADELSKRQAVQYRIIDKDRVICELQASLAEYLTGVSSPYHRHRVLQAESDGDGSLIVPPHPDTIVELSPVQGARNISSDGYSSLSIRTGGSSMAGATSSGARMLPWLACPAMATRAAPPMSPRNCLTGTVTAAVSAGAVGALPAVQVLYTGSGGVPPCKGCEAAPRRMMRSSTCSWGGVQPSPRCASQVVAQQHGPMSSGVTAAGILHHSVRPAQTGGVMRQSPSWLHMVASGVEKLSPHICFNIILH